MEDACHPCQARLRGAASLAHTSSLSAMASAPPQELLGSVNVPSEGAERGWDLRRW